MCTSSAKLPAQLIRQSWGTSGKHFGDGTHERVQVVGIAAQKRRWQDEALQKPDSGLAVFVSAKWRNAQTQCF